MSGGAALLAYEAGRRTIGAVAPSTPATAGANSANPRDAAAHVPKQAAAGTSSSAQQSSTGAVPTALSQGACALDAHAAPAGPRTSQKASSSIRMERGLHTIRAHYRPSIKRRRTQGRPLSAHRSSFGASARGVQVIASLDNAGVGPAKPGIRLIVYLCIVLKLLLIAMPAARAASAGPQAVDPCIASAGGQAVAEAAAASLDSHGCRSAGFGCQDAHACHPALVAGRHAPMAAAAGKLAQQREQCFRQVLSPPESPPPLSVLR